MRTLWNFALIWFNVLNTLSLGVLEYRGDALPGCCVCWADPVVGFYALWLEQGDGVEVPARVVVLLFCLPLGYGLPEATSNVSPKCVAGDRSHEVDFFRSVIKIHHSASIRHQIVEDDPPPIVSIDVALPIYLELCPHIGRRYVQR